MTFDSLFVIRSAAERTVSLCKKLILEQGVPDEQIVVVQEVPFSVAMRKSFEMGIEYRYKYTFCVDADVLLRPGSIQYMLDEFEKKPDNVCEIQGLVMDKFFGGPRPAGNHLFRTSLLHEVIKRIPEEGVNIRPEYTTLNHMMSDGYPWLNISYVVGTHDDEQNNYDIYRKCFVQGVKHLYLAELFVSHWKRNIEIDKDYSVALKAFTDSIKCNEKLYINAKQQVYKNGFEKSDFEEKLPLDTAKYTLEMIENRIQTWQEPEEYFKYFPKNITAKNIPKIIIKNIPERIIAKNIPKKPFSERIKNLFRTKGAVKIFPYISGRVLIGVGNRLVNISK